jgi:hypothetical protein
VELPDDYMEMYEYRLYRVTDVIYRHMWHCVFFIIQQ